MAKTQKSLQQGIEAEADRKGLSGAARRNYIGGTIGNLAKRGVITIHRKAAAPKASHPRIKPRPKMRPASSAAAKPMTHHTPPKTKKPYQKPTITAKPLAPKEKIALVVRKSGDRYKIHNAKTGAVWNSAVFKTLSKAKAEAKIEQDAYNAGLKRGRL